MTHQTIRQSLEERLGQAAARLREENGLPLPPDLDFNVAPPKQELHGDFATAVALGLARELRRNPREIAGLFQEALGDAGGVLERTEIAGPGYLNLFVSERAWHEALLQILERGEDFIRSDDGKGERILLEFVSANPTGPLHIAHGRGAVLGDVLARLFDAAGYVAEREYYVNDLGHQADVLGRSVHHRYLERCGLDPGAPPEDFYPGAYVEAIAAELHEAFGDTYADAPETAWLPLFRERAMRAMRRRIEEDLERFGVRFDRWVSERELVERVGLERLLRRLEEGGHVYEEGGKKWFRTTAYGDDKDRVVVREDGRPTYFASDIAYHADKLERGFDRLINIWGADHGGYIKRVKAGLAALGHDPERLEILLVQMVSLSRGGESIRMGKRLGTAVWLSDVVDEVGRDATRYFFLMRRADAQMDFDVELATRRTLDNPVYYAQMGHARLCSIAERAREAGYDEPRPSLEALAPLRLPEEIGLIKAMVRSPEIVAAAARTREPHQVTHYVAELIGQFHSYYTRYKNDERVVSDDPAKTVARLLLCRGLQAILRALLVTILGVSAPERMTLDDATAPPGPAEEGGNPRARDAEKSP